MTKIFPEYFLRIFFDTNALASTLMSHGLCCDLLDRVLVERDVLLGEPVRLEMRRVLAAKFKVPTGLWRELEIQLDRLLKAPGVDPALPVSIPDADDVPVFACAMAAKADVFVTGELQ